MKRITILLLGLAVSIPLFAQVPDTNPENKAITGSDKTERCVCFAPNPKERSPLGESPYWVFIGFLYAYIAADIAGRFAKVSYKWTRYKQSKRKHWWVPVHSHLALTSFVVGTSWMAWSKAFALRHVVSPNEVISAQALLVIVDFYILVLYFALVLVVGNERESGRCPDLAGPARKHSSYWIAWILSAYATWDCFTFFVVPRWTGCTSCFCARSWMSLLCAALAWLAFSFLRNVRIDRPLWMLAADASMLALILFYRALKQMTEPEGPVPVWLVAFKWSAFSVFVILVGFAAAYGKCPPSTRATGGVETSS